MVNSFSGSLPDASEKELQAMNQLMAEKENQATNELLQAGQI
jgi:hypothetical protein